MNTLITRSALGLLLATGLMGCANDDSGEPSAAAATTASSEYRATLTVVADEVVIPAYANLINSTGELLTSVQNYCAAIGGVNEAANLAQAQASWRSALNDIQTGLAFQLGPINENDQALAKRLNSPELANRCVVDRSVVSFDDGLVTVDAVRDAGRGADALEYLLFNSTLTHTCPASVVETQNWNALSDDERLTQRCAYAEALATDLNSTAQSLHNAWISGGDDYRSNFINAGTAGSDIASQDDALTAAFEALFYLDTEVKDTKLGVPFGLHQNCFTTTCEDELQFTLSESGARNLLSNLQGFKALLVGGFSDQAAESGESLGAVNGFDDILRVRGFASTVDDLLAKTDAGIVSLEAFVANDQTLVDEVQNIANATQAQICQNASDDPSTATSHEACQIHGQIRQITDILKGTFADVINIRLPERAESDND
ncbi:imelysin family protein [Litoribacillus peritrichatus]|uniref:Imelysin-like domain-containing protein n=1 Tax=Litoribacillus peritrichatus TaxID=718191 RepID=A0ABP7NBM1_9GAMM